ncbi:MAG: hypothetical protein KY469_10565 [Actinobacteria bacterium]|nr:hypothetical protein [Actinomycetota bacterium]
MHKVEVMFRDDGHVVHHDVLATDDQGHELTGLVYPPEPLSCGCDTGPRVFVEGDGGDGCCVDLIRAFVTAVEEVLAVPNPHVGEECPYRDLVAVPS